MRDVAESNHLECSGELIMLEALLHKRTLLIVIVVLAIVVGVTIGVVNST